MGWVIGGLVVLGVAAVLIQVGATTLSRMREQERPEEWR